MSNILQNIIEYKKESLIKIKKNNSLDSVEKKIKDLNFFYEFQKLKKLVHLQEC
jgi:hypothetical protein